MQVALLFWYLTVRNNNDIIACCFEMTKSLIKMHLIAVIHIPVATLKTSCMVWHCVQQYLIGSLFNDRQQLEDTRELQQQQDAALQASIKY